MPLRPYKKRKKISLTTILKSTISWIPKWLWITSIIVIIMGYTVYWCRMSQEVTFTGKTMGTTYTVKVYVPRFTKTDDIKKDIETRLAQIDHSLSLTNPNSEINQFNRVTENAKPMIISRDFTSVMEQVEMLYKLSDGAYDPTIKPLMDLWGFSGRDHLQVPSPNLIIEAKKNVGLSQLVVSGNTILKKNPNIQLDLSSLSKGYAVDQMRQVMIAHQRYRFLVEVGGVAYSSGKRKHKKQWRVGISLPDPESEQSDLLNVIPISNMALAIKGDNKNYFEKDGIRYCDIFDPKTGRPIENNVMTVSVLAPSCALADGLGTTLMVLGPEKGLKFIQRFIGVEAMFTVRKEEQDAIFKSPGFPIGQTQ
jgi:thiamine biosynthesis lipoprotein